MTSKAFSTFAAFFALFLGVLPMRDDAAAKSNPRILIAYYSRSGNTEIAAKEIQKTVGGDLFKIETPHAYPDSYKPMTEQAKKEIADGFRPALTGTVSDIRSYDAVFVGSPNWWGTLPPAVSSFLDAHDLSGKTVIPFVTHGGGGQQRTLSDFKAQCAGCAVKDGFVASGDTTRGLNAWLSDVMK